MNGSTREKEKKKAYEIIVRYQRERIVKGGIVRPSYQEVYIIIH